MGSGKWLLNPLKAVLAFTLLQISHAAVAAIDCPNGIDWYWQQSSTEESGPFLSASAACSDAMQNGRWGTPQEQFPAVSVSVHTNSTGDPVRCDITYENLANPTAPPQLTTFYLRWECRAEPDCEAGQVFYGTSPSATACINGCELTHEFIAATPDDPADEFEILIFGTWTTTGQMCPTGDPLSEVGGDPEGQRCMEVNGETVCFADDQPTNCGEINGEQVCLETVPDDGCITTESGASVCGSNAPDQDRPTNTDGTPQEPTLDLGTGSGLGGTLPPQYYGGGSDGGDGGDDGTGDDNSDLEPCPEGETCDDTGSFEPGGPDDWYTPDDQKTFGTVLQGFTTRVGNAPFIAAANGFFNITLSGSSCPVWTVDAWIFSLTMDAHCSSFMEDLWPIVRTILLAIAAFTAFRWAFL